LRGADFKQQAEAIKAADGVAFRAQDLKPFEPLLFYVRLPAGSLREDMRKDFLAWIGAVEVIIGIAGLLLALKN
jgi:hypothetical protein